MSERVRQGHIGEMFVALEAAKRGYIVSYPATHDSYYDLIVDKNNSLRRVQVKRVYQVNNHGRLTRCVESKRIFSAKRLPYPDNSYDILAAVDVESANVWFVPFDVAKKYKAQMYLDSSKYARFKDDWTLL